MKDSQLIYWLGLSGLNFLGIKGFLSLKKYFGSVEKIFKASKKDLVKLGISPKRLDSYFEWRAKTDFKLMMEKIKKQMIKVIWFDNNSYPKLLKEVDISPFLLFVKGDEKILNQPCLAVVGTRKVSPYGRAATFRLVRGLVNNNLVIVSGLARGVDSAAHRACLESRGKTAAVLGHGLERIYPAENKGLALEIVKKGGALITEYPMGYPIKRGNFPLRNRIIAGLSQGVLVVEGAHKSGTKITASWAANFNREVFAVPGPIGSRGSEATSDLIKEGAKLVNHVDDILEELRL